MGQPFAAVERALVRWFSAQAADYIGRRVTLWAGVSGWAPSRVLIRDQRQRWGSCAPDGTLRFSWGNDTSNEDIDTAIEAIRAVAQSRSTAESVGTVA